MAVATLFATLAVGPQPPPGPMSWDRLSVAVDQKQIGAFMREDAGHRAAIALRIAAGLARAEDRDPLARETPAHANSSRKGSSAMSGSGSTPAVCRNMQTCEYWPTVQTRSIAV